MEKKLKAMMINSTVINRGKFSVKNSYFPPS